jgi:hypothetical protein
VGDDHVAESAGLLVEAGPHADRNGLRNVYLDVIDVVSIPDRLEHAVGEAHRQQVLHRLAAEVVVDAEDVLLLEDGEKAGVQLTGRLQVEAEGLLGDHLGALAEAEHTKLPYRIHHRARRQCQVVQYARALAQFPASLLDSPGKRPEPVADVDEAQALGKALPGVPR